MRNAVEIATSPTPENEPAGDRFSSDVFGTNGETSVMPVDLGDNNKRELRRQASWAARLPKVSRKLLESSFGDEKLPGQLPEILSKAIEDAMGEVVFKGSGLARCKLGSIVECDLSAESAASGRAGNLAVQIVFEATRSYGVVLVGGSFVHSIIDKIFGPSGYEASKRISPIETAIAEFLAVRVVAHINDSLGSEFFSVGETSLTPAEFFSEHEVGAKACIELESESVSQLFQVLISRGFLSGLKQSGTIFNSDADAGEAVKLFRTMASVPLRAQIGSTRLEISALSFLEPGDVVIIEKPQLDWNGGSPEGVLRLLAGAGANFVITGEIITDKNTGFGGMSVLVKDILSKEAVNDSYTAGSIMEEKKLVAGEWEEGSKAQENDAADEGAAEQESNEMSASLENLQLRLRVELGGNKMSLREINNLRIGQVIDLGRSPTDTVDLVTDGSDESVAVGELVDIEGRLGVRLTKVFL